MSRKIFSFQVENGIGPFNMPNIKDNSIIDTIKHLGYYPDLKREYFSYDSTNVEFVENNEEYKVKIYDNDNEEDVKELKEALARFQDIRFRVMEMEQIQMGKISQLDVLLGIADKNEEVIQKIRNVRNSQDEFLKDLGFPGFSIFY